MLNFIRENLMKRRDLLNDGAAHVGGSLAEVDIPSMLGKAIADAEFGKRKRFPSEAAEPVALRRAVGPNLALDQIQSGSACLLSRV